MQLALRFYLIISMTTYEKSITKNLLKQNLKLW